MFTEEQAKTRWCPFARDKHVESDPKAYSCYPSPVTATNKGARCIASDCMAWRWNIGNVRGYCGLAGHPERT